MWKWFIKKRNIVLTVPFLFIWVIGIFIIQCLHFWDNFIGSIILVATFLTSLLIVDFFNMVLKSKEEKENITIKKILSDVESIAEK